MDISERKILRSELLKKIYDHYFETGGEKYEVSIRILNDDPEGKMALEYLKEKGYIVVTYKGDGSQEYAPTVSGIDIVEDGKGTGIQE